MEKKFQVFISSTYEDLIVEREIVSLAVLRSHNIPSGMELSSGANERTLNIIYRWIDDSDVFILLIGGRYGSVDDASGKSYTELEFHYAKAQNKPVIALSLTDGYLAQKVASGAIAASAAYEQANVAELAEFRRMVAGDSYCIPVSSIAELEAKILSALDSVRVSYSPGGWIRTTSMLESIVDTYATYLNRYLAVLGNDQYARHEIEDLLRSLNAAAKVFVASEVVWLDVMLPVLPTESDRPNLLLTDVRTSTEWLKVLFTSVRRTRPPMLIPIEVNGVPWRGSGNALMSCGIDYVSSFRGRYLDGYGLPERVARDIDRRYEYWRKEHYFGSLLAVAVMASVEDPPSAIGVLNLNFSTEAPLGNDDTLSPQRSMAILNVLEPALRVVGTAIERHVDRRGGGS